MRLWEDPMGVLWSLVEPDRSQWLWGLRESYGSQQDSGKTLWGLGESYGSQWGSGRTLWGSTGLWEDLGVTYGVWGNPMGLSGALGGPYGGQRGCGMTSG